MKKEHDFSHGRRGPAVSTSGKTRITIYLENSTLERFKAESKRTGKGYQALINEALAQHANRFEPPAESAEDRSRPDPLA